MKKALVLGALALLLAASAHAQAVNYTTGTKALNPNGTPVGGYTSSDSLFKPVQVTSAGAIVTSEASPNRETYTSVPITVSTATLTTGGAADSCVAQDVHKYRSLGLLVGTPAGWARIAVQVRFHNNGLSDSTSIFTVPSSVTGWGDTTIVVGALPTTTTPGSQEFLCKMLRQTAGESATGVNQTARKYYPLMWQGGPVWFSTVSVRVRVLAGPTSTVPVTVYLVGSSL